MTTVTSGKIALLWRGNREARNKANPESNRLRGVFDALAALNIAAEPAVYSDDMVEEVREQLLRVDGVLVWVDPISEGQDRSTLDAMLREVSARGVWVSAHPDVILKMGTKEILFRTRHLGWGTDTTLYNVFEEFWQQFPARLISAGPRVLKQYRGNGGIGTWKIEMIAGRAAASDNDLIVRAQEARGGAFEEELRLSDFMRRCEAYFAGSGRLIDQLFQPRVGEGMIRCYLVQNEVVGFSTQAPRSAGNFAMAREKTMFGALEPRFRALKDIMESQWVPAVMRILDLDIGSMPVIWDADFLYGPKTSAGQDTYVLCEINISAVFPFPDQATSKIAQAAAARLISIRKLRSASDVATRD